MSSVFFNPAASDVMMEAAIQDILDNLKRGAELLQSGAIAVAVLKSFSKSLNRRFSSPSAPPPPQQQPPAPLV